MKAPAKKKVEKSPKNNLGTEKPLAEKDEVKDAEEKQRKKTGFNSK